MVNSLYPCSRYNTLTSDNVNRLTSCLRIRSHPVILLDGYKRHVACKCTENSETMEGYGVLTPYASRKVDNLIDVVKWGKLMYA